MLSRLFDLLVNLEKISDGSQDYCSLEIVVTTDKTLIPSPQHYENYIPLITGKFPVITDLAKSLLFSAYVNSLSAAFGLHL